MNPFRQVAAVAALFILVGVGCFIAGAILFLHTRAFIATAKTASGSVVGVDPGTDSHGAPTYHTVFSFTDDSGATHTIRASYSQSPPPYRIGDQVAVLYQPASPESARVRSFVSLWLAPTILGGIGLVFPTVAVLVFKSARSTYGSSP